MKHAVGKVVSIIDHGYMAKMANVDWHDECHEIPNEVNVANLVLEERIPFEASNPMRRNPLSEKRFSKSDVTFGEPYGKKEKHTIYSYESGDAIYDVIVIDGVRYPRKNGRTLRANEPWDKIHLAIIKHFNLPGTMSNPVRRKPMRKNPYRRARRNPSISQIKAKNRELGHHFFDKDASKFFGSKIYPTVYGGRFFVTSEKNPSGVTRYSVREAQPNGAIKTVGEFHSIRHLEDARDAAKRLAKQKSNPRKHSKRRC